MDKIHLFIQTVKSPNLSHFTSRCNWFRQPEYTIKGDVNADKEFDLADVNMLQKWLLAYPDVELANWEAGDLNNDGRLDAVDLTLMKRALLNS